MYHESIEVKVFHTFLSCFLLAQKRQRQNIVRGLAERFRGGLTFKAHRLVYHTTLGLREIKKEKGLVDGRTALCV